MTARYHVTCDCSFTRDYATQAMADRGRRTHSCAKWRARAARAERGRARAAAVDRTPVDCQHTRTHHDHGTHAAYVLDRCRCTPCARANADYENHRTRQAAYGRWEPYVDAQPARDHVRALMAAGMGLKRIVAVSGISQGVLWKLVYGKRRADGTQQPSRRVRAATADRLLATHVDLASATTVPAHGTTLRLRALVALGHTQSTLAQRLGVQPSNATALFAGTRDVQRRTADAVARLYDELSMTVPTTDNRYRSAAITRARAHAADRGWLPPLALDDDRLDDPTYVPEPDKPPARRRRGDEVVDAWLELREHGESDHAIATRLGISTDSLERAVARARANHDPRVIPPAQEAS